ERRHGYAHEAYMAKLKEFGTYGAVDKLTAQVAVKNTASQEFLKKAGFQPVQEVEADCCSIEGEPAVLMIRDMADLKITQSNIVLRTIRLEFLDRAGLGADGHAAFLAQIDDGDILVEELVLGLRGGQFMQRQTRVARRQLHGDAILEG